MTTIGERLGDELAALGVRRVFGSSLGAAAGLPTYATPDEDLAATMADADGRLGSGWGAAVVADRLLHLSSRPGGTAHPVTITEPGELWAALGGLRHQPAPATVALDLELDLAAPSDEVDDEGPASPGWALGPQPTLDPALADLRLAVLVGPGVWRGGALDALHRLAERAGVAVLNTWGAKGVFRWDSPWHGGTVGLQAFDAELAGLTHADVVVTCGLDPDEAAVALHGGAPTVDVHPAHLEHLLARWPGADRPLPAPTELYRRISEVVRPGYERTDVPLHPARAALHCSGAGGDDAVVVADAGLAGFWIARAFPTGVVGSVVVPGARQAGFAAAAALVAALDGRPALGIVDGGPGDGALDDETTAVLELARSWGERLHLQAWCVDGPPTETAAHVDATVAAFGADGVDVTTVGIDGGALADLEAVAGPVVAWGGLGTGS